MKPDEKLIHIIRSMPGVSAQNRLMSVSDRELALSMMYLKDPDRMYVLSYLSPQKAKRVAEELKLHERLNVRYGIYRTAVEGVLEHLVSDNKGGLKSYLRPVRFRRRS